MLAAELQRANIARRLERVEANPARAVLGAASSVVSRPAALTLGAAALRFALRAWRKRRAARQAHH